MERISIIVPALNEAAVIAFALAPWTDQYEVELIVVDGGSIDATPMIARAFARVLMGPRGRARQMNAGAAAATGEILVFLHADTRLPRSAVDSIRATLSDPQTIGGAFRLAIDSHRWLLRMVAAIANLRCRWFGLPYGDQALFFRRSVFERLGGFPDLPLMEDVALVRAARRLGRLALLRDSVQTSARRWRRDGVLFVSLRNQLFLGLFLLGVSPVRLARWYRDIR